MMKVKYADTKINSVHCRACYPPCTCLSPCTFSHLSSLNTFW